MEEYRKAEQKYHKLKPLRFLAVFLYYSIYKMRSQNRNKPPEYIIDWLNAWRAYRGWREKSFLASFGNVKVRDPYSYHCKPYRNIKNIMLVVRQPEN